MESDMLCNICNTEIITSLSEQPRHHLQGLALIFEINRGNSVVKLVAFLTPDWHVETAYAQGMIWGLSPA